MRWLAATSIVLALAVPAAAAFMAAGVNGIGAVVDPPQVPTLLSSYSYKPTWQVAGVNFYVGVPSSVALKNPATMSIPGASVDTTNHRIVVDNTATNVVIDGYDFSLNGGWYVYDWTNTGTVTISNSYFLVGTNHQTPITAASGTGNLTVTNCTLDGALDSNTTLSTLISYTGSGTVTVTNSWFKNSISDDIDINTNPTTIILTNNLFQNQGYNGAHGDVLQILGTGPYTATVKYNTVVQGSIYNSQGIMLEPDNGAIHGNVAGGEIAFNTFTGAISYFVGVTLADLSGTVTYHDNYFELADGAFNFSPGSTRGGYNDGNAYSVYTNNVNMVTGALYQDSPPGTP